MEDDEDDDPEPWYYRAVEWFAWGCIALAVGQAMICTLLALKGMAEGQDAGTLPEAVWRVPYSLAAMVGAGLIAAAVLLMVDVARNIRAIRNNTEPE